jgi:hypothetical protein
VCKIWLLQKSISNLALSDCNNVCHFPAQTREYDEHMYLQSIDRFLITRNHSVYKIIRSLTVMSLQRSKRKTNMLSGMHSLENDSLHSKIFITLQLPLLLDVI